jgi:nucleotide-binding universal stress UspA family protein
MNQRTPNGTHTKALGPPSRHVVVGYDGSAASDAALEHAAQLAGVNEVYVEHSYTPPSNRLGHAS